MSVSRRNFIKGAAAGTAGTALTAGVLAGGARADADAGGGQAEPASTPFHGIHQAGVLTPGPAGKQAFASFAAFDVAAGSLAELADLMRTLTGRARFLATGGTPANLGIRPAALGQRRPRGQRCPLTG